MFTVLATDVIGYTFDADTYCVECTVVDLVDADGNLPTPVFGSDELQAGSVCGSCFVELSDPIVWSCDGTVQLFEGDFCPSCSDGEGF